MASINRQRDDLVKMLKALADLSSVGTRVIRSSKTATIDSLRALAPTLTKLAEAGDALPKSLQVFLTYPFVDAVVGTNPAQARNLHMGDYTNLSAQLDLDLGNAGAPASTRRSSARPGPASSARSCAGTLCDAALACIDQARTRCKAGACTQGLRRPGLQQRAQAVPGHLRSARRPALWSARSHKCSGVARPRQVRPAATVGDLKAACQDARYKRVPRVPAREPRTGAGGCRGLPSLRLPTPTCPPCRALGRAGVRQPDVAAAGVRRPDSDLGALLVWGMVQR